MNNFIEIITLQNATFNLWAWIIGTIILLIIAGVTFKENPENTIFVIVFSFVWPIFAGLALVIGVLLSPMWVGMKLGDYWRTRHEQRNPN